MIEILVIYKIVVYYNMRKISKTIFSVTTTLYF